MALQPRVQAKPHLFMPGETVSGAIKKINLYDTTPEEMNTLIEQFKKINTEPIIRPGMNGLIPVLPRHYSAVFETK